MILVKMFLLACVATTVEVLAVAIVGFFDKNKLPLERLRGVGFSYIWSFGIYFTASALFIFIFYILTPVAWYWMILISYVMGLVLTTLIETGCGWLLNKWLGFCPWSHYTKEEGGILLGYSTWMWSLGYGVAMVALYFLNNAMRWL
jgi:hypothetical protein